MSSSQTAAYPPSSTMAAPAPYSAPPPAGYPTMENSQFNQNPPTPVETKSRGDGFWKGCCAGLCCCCALETCF